MAYEPDPYEEIDEGEQRPQSAPFKQLRDHAKKLEKELKERDKLIEELASFKAEAENRAKRELLRQSFQQVGLNEKHAELFEAARPDVEPTPEAVKSFAVEYGFISAPGSDEEKGEDTGSFAPTPPSGVPAHKQRLSSEEFDQLYKVNPIEAMQAATEGRVDFQKTL